MNSGDGGAAIAEYAEFNGDHCCKFPRGEKPAHCSSHRVGFIHEDDTLKLTLAKGATMIGTSCSKWRIRRYSRSASALRVKRTLPC